MPSRAGQRGVGRRVPSGLVPPLMTCHQSVLNRHRGPPRAPIQRAGRGPVDLRSQEAPKCTPSSRSHRHCPHSQRAPTHRLALHLCLNAVAHRRQDGLWLSQHRSHSSQAEDRCYLLFSRKLASPRPQQSRRTSSVPGAVLCSCDTPGDRAPWSSFSLVDEGTGCKSEATHPGLCPSPLHD